MDFFAGVLGGIAAAAIITLSSVGDYDNRRYEIYDDTQKIGDECYAIVENKVINEWYCKSEPQ